jgi:hypothetical protein
MNGAEVAGSPPVVRFLVYELRYGMLDTAQIVRRNDLGSMR